MTERNDASWQLRMAAQTLHAGGVVLHATESVWGLACDPFNHHALARLLALKQRQVQQGVLLIGGSAEHFAPELAGLDGADRERVLQSWPAGVSWLLPNVQYPAWITGQHPRVGVRVPGHAQARALCMAFGGAIVSTSANLSGQPAPKGRWQAQRAMGQRVDYVLHGAVGGAANPSRILGLDGDRVR